MRLPLALVHVAGILVGYALLRRIWDERIGFIVAMIWASDPFLVGYSRLLHVDALTATFILISVLAACAYWHHRRHPGLLTLSEAAAGMAWLSKSPALALLPFVAGVALADAWNRAGLEPALRRRLRKALLDSARPLLIWCLLAAATVSS
jgi:4-amino-4-deoxy-L-arabinose transferase-like glycosyltransferase